MEFVLLKNDMIFIKKTIYKISKESNFDVYFQIEIECQLQCI